MGLLNVIQAPFLFSSGKYQVFSAFTYNNRRMNMNSIQKSFVAIGLFLVASAVSAKDLNSKFQLLPLPQKVEVFADNGLRGCDLFLGR